MFLDMSADSLGEVLDGAAGLKEDLSQAPELELRLGREGAAGLADVHLPAPVHVQDHLEVGRVPEEENHWRRAGDETVAKLSNFRLSFCHGDLAESGGRVSSQVSQSGSKLLARDIDNHTPPVLIPIFL